MFNIQDLLKQAKEIIVLEKDVSRNRERAAVSFEGDLAKKCYDATLLIDNGFPEFQRYWEFNKETGQINGCSTFQLARLARVLPKEAELPNILDGIALDERGKLPRGFCTDLGIVVYSAEGSNVELHRRLAEKAGKDREFPLIYAPGDLNCIVANGHVEIAPVAKPRRIISGQDAVKALEKFYKGSSKGTCRVYQNGNGDKLAAWDSFSYSGSEGLVNWLVVEC